MDPVVHFEMPAENKKRMSTFYTQTFGWETQQLGPDMGDYTLVTTSESDDKGPKERGRINGGFFPKSEDQPAKHPMLVIAVKDIKESMKKIEIGGGKVDGQPVEIPGIGQYVSFIDTEGNRLSILQPLTM